MPSRKRMKTVNKSMGDLSNLRTLDVPSKRQALSNRFSQISSISSEFSFDATFPNVIENSMELRPLYFEVPQSESNCSLLCRQWIFQEISQAVASPNLQGVVLFGEDGSGKTSLILQLVDWSIFAGNRRSSILNDVPLTMLHVLEKLASQVVGYHFCQKDCQSTCLIPDFIHSLAAQLCQVPQLADYRNTVMKDQSYQHLLSLDACIENPDDAFQKGILQPLLSISKHPLVSALLVIDSIHEAEGKSPSICSFLATYISQFPSWLKVVMSVNVDDVNLVSTFPFHQINLNRNEFKVQEDLLQYIWCRTQEFPEIQQKMSSWRDEKQISRFADYLVGSVKTSFLYVKLVLDLLQQNHLVIKSSSFNVIPVSLDEVFTLIFNLRFPSIATFSKVRPILEICLASRSPLTAVEIFYCLESMFVTPSFLWLNFTLVLNTLADILIQRKDGSLMICHPCLRRWLTQNKKFNCDVRSGHSYLALYSTRLRCPLTLGKKADLIYHLSRCNLFDAEESFKILWTTLFLTLPSDVLKSSPTAFWPDREVFLWLLKAGADSNSTLGNTSRDPILNLMCKMGQQEIVSLLLDFGADHKKTNILGMSPLMEAATHGHLEIVKMLLVAGAEVHHQGMSGLCAMSCAAEKGYVDIVDLLVMYENWSSTYRRSQAIQRATKAGTGNYQIREYFEKMKESSINSISKLEIKSANSSGHNAACQVVVESKTVQQDQILPTTTGGQLVIFQALKDRETVQKSLPTVLKRL